MLSDSSDEDEIRQQQGGMSYAAASDMEQGLSSAQIMMGSSPVASQGLNRSRAEQGGQVRSSSALMEESEALYPGSGFFD